MKRFFRIRQNMESIAVYSARSALKSEVANSYLNWLWWVLDPLCFMLIYTFIFGVVFDGSEPYFPIFIFIGLTMWDFFNRTMTTSIKIVKNNKAIVSKVYLPKFVLIYVKMMVNAFKMLISFAIVAAYDDRMAGLLRISAYCMRCLFLLFCLFFHLAVQHFCCILVCLWKTYPM